jgi:hypothetical protein
MFTIEITTTASTFKSVFILSSMSSRFVFTSCFVCTSSVLVTCCGGGKVAAIVSTSSRHQPQRSCQKYSASVANRAVGSHSTTKLQWKSAVRHWVWGHLAVGGMLPQVFWWKVWRLIWTCIYIYIYIYIYIEIVLMCPICVRIMSGWWIK